MGGVKDIVIAADCDKCGEVREWSLITGRGGGATKREGGGT